MIDCLYATIGICHKYNTSIFQKQLAQVVGSFMGSFLTGWCKLITNFGPLLIATYSFYSFNLWTAKRSQQRAYLSFVHWSNCHLIGIMARTMASFWFDLPLLDINFEVEFILRFGGRPCMCLSLDWPGTSQFIGLVPSEVHILIIHFHHFLFFQIWLLLIDLVPRCRCITFTVKPP